MATTPSSSAPSTDGAGHSELDVELTAADADLDDGPRMARDTGSASDNTTLTSVLEGLAAKGFRGQLKAVEGGGLECVSCGVTSPAADFEISSLRRMEGASDPDDMMTVVAARCPVCGVTGTAVLGFGPTASEADGDVTAALTTVHRHGAQPDT